MCWSCLCYFPIAASASSWQTPNRLCCPVLTLRAAAEQSAPPTRPKAAKSGFWPCAAILSRYCRWRKGEESRVLGFARLCAVFLQLCKGRRGKVRRIRVPAARLHTGRGSLEARRRRRGSFRSGKGASGRSLPKTGEWPVPSEPARMGPLAVRRRRRKPSGRHVFIRAELAGSSSNLSPFQSGMSSPGRIGRQLFPHGESDVRHVSGRVGHSFSVENRSCFCGQQFLRGSSSCFSPKNRYHIDIAKVRGAKAAFSTSGVKRCRRRPRTF